MSKCDISVEFRPADRQYRTGATVQGLVRVEVHEDVQCRGLALNAFWKTHGRGNTARQNYFHQTFSEGSWQAGQTLEFEFEFTPPLTPLTYHGRYLNIDHYVSVRADIPWSIDPRCEEEFLWQAGSQVPELAEAAPVLESRSGCGRTIGLLVAAGLAVAAVLVAVVAGLQAGWLLLIPAALLTFLCLRRRLAERKLGEVKWGTLATAFAGEAMPSLLQIGPLGNVKIREVTTAVRGIEQVVSGSGTDTTTHTHSLHNEQRILVSAPKTRRGEVLELEPELLFPQSSAWSVDLPDNRVIWTVTLAIRLAFWPDWVETREVTLLGHSDPVSGQSTSHPDRSQPE
jgi:hypothetical protein